MTIKQSCPDCKTIIEIDENEFGNSDAIMRQCPLCGSMVEFVIPKAEKKQVGEDKIVVKEVESEASKRKLEELEEKLKTIEQQEHEEKRNPRWPYLLIVGILIIGVVIGLYIGKSGNNHKQLANEQIEQWAPAQGNAGEIGSQTFPSNSSSNTSNFDSNDAETMPAVDEMSKSIPVFITDDDVTTNVRDAPNGEILRALPNSHRLYYFHVDKVVNSWLRVEKYNAKEYYCQYKGQSEDLEYLGNPLQNFAGECWVHNTVVRTSCIGRFDMPEEISLVSSPNSHVVSCVINKNRRLERLIVMQIRDNWVQLKTSSGKLGWLDSSKMNFELYFEAAL